jgi:hypothetical protein
VELCPVPVLLRFTGIIASLIILHAFSVLKSELEPIRGAEPVPAPVVTASRLLS